jgi:DNA-binding transcriptional MerR regulator
MLKTQNMRIPSRATRRTLKPHVGVRVKCDGARRTDVRIGELATATGVSVRALRFYEERGVLTPHREPNGYRRFGPADVATVGHVRTLLAAGLGLDVIREVLSCMAGPELLLADCHERLEGERQRMIEQADQLNRAREILDRLLAAG